MQPPSTYLIFIMDIVSTFKSPQFICKAKERHILYCNECPSHPFLRIFLFFFFGTSPRIKIGHAILRSLRSDKNSLTNIPLHFGNTKYKQDAHYLHVASTKLRISKIIEYFFKNRHWSNAQKSRFWITIFLSQTLLTLLWRKSMISIGKTCQKFKS